MARFTKLQTLLWVFKNFNISVETTRVVILFVRHDVKQKVIQIRNGIKFFQELLVIERTVPFPALSKN